MTNNLELRVAQHRLAFGDYTSRHRIYRLVYFEDASDVRDAIAREKQLKRWKRIRKIQLIESVNPEWLDLLPQADLS